MDTDADRQPSSVGREPGLASQAPQRYKAAELTWIAVYPTITLVLAAIQALGLDHLALPLRTLIATLVVVPAVVLGLTPLLARLSKGWSAHGPSAADPQEPAPQAARAPPARRRSE